jgi:hypothetical protein
MRIRRERGAAGSIGFRAGLPDGGARAAERVRYEHSQKHPEYPLERLCTHVYEPFQLAFAQRARQLFEDRDDVGLVASHQGLTIRAETEEAIDAAVEVLSDFYGAQIRTGPPTIRYHDGVSLEQPWMGLRVRCQAEHLEPVRMDLVVRNATIVSCEPHVGGYAIQACGPLAHLIGYGSTLEKLTSGSAQSVMWLSHYAPVERLPPDGDAA